MAKLEVATKLERDAALASAQKSEAESLQLQDAFSAKEATEVELVAKLTHTQEQLRKNKEEAAQYKAELRRTQVGAALVQFAHKCILLFNPPMCRSNYHAVGGTNA